jgi:hypothetical protein
MPWVFDAPWSIWFTIAAPVCNRPPSFFPSPHRIVLTRLWRAQISFPEPRQDPAYFQMVAEMTRTEQPVKRNNQPLASIPLECQNFAKIKAHALTNRRYIIMLRRTLLTTMFGLAISAGVVFAQTDPLAESFAMLGVEKRRAVQEQLAMAGLYDGVVDGAFGPKTRNSLINGAVFIKDNSYGRVAFDLTKPDQARQFIGALANGELAKYLWGEGDESESG